MSVIALHTKRWTESAAGFRPGGINSKVAYTEYNPSKPI